MTRNEYSANQALQPVPLATRLQSAGWNVGRNALQPVKPRAHALPTKRGFFARFFSF